MTFRVGLTGGIGSGKSTVARLFADHGVPIIDADEVARLVVQPGHPALTEVVNLFGAEMLDAQGQLHRSALRKRIFQDPDSKKKLEQILHPRIYAAMEEQVPQTAGTYCILVVPLLLETGERQRVQRLLVVDTPPDLQLQRVMQRDQLTATEANAIIHSQVARGERLEAADDIVVNDRDIEHLRNQVEALHKHYMALAQTEAHSG